MSNRTDPADYDTEDEESMIDLEVDQLLYTQVMKSMGLNPNNEQKLKPMDKQLLLNFLEFKSIEAKKDIERIKGDNLDKLDTILTKLNALNLPADIITKLIDGPMTQLHQNTERTGISNNTIPETEEQASRKQFTGWSQVTPPQTQAQNQAQAQAHAQAHARTQALHSRTLSQPMTVIPPQHSNQTFLLPPPPPHPHPAAGNMAGPSQQYNTIPGFNGASVKYFFPPPPTQEMSPNSAYNKTVLYYPQRYPPGPNEYGPSNGVNPAYKQAADMPSARMGHKRSYSAMTVPEMRTFTVRGGEQSDFTEIDNSKRSGKVSFLINTPKNPPR